MTKPTLNLIDMKFDSKGHYIDDLKEFNFLTDKYECIYYAPDIESKAYSKVIDTMDVKTSAKGLAFYFLIYRLMLLKRKDKIFFLSCSFIPLLILSILSLNFNYIFRIHSMPVIRVRIYKYIIRIISDLSINTVFLDYPVKDYFVSCGYSNNKKSVCIVGRTLNINNITPFSSGKFNLLFIGAMNNEKDLKPVIEALCEEKIENLSLSFLSKGIDRYETELNKLKLVYDDVVISNDFLERDDYDNAINKSDALILPYKESYGVRFSAVLNDALSLGKKVLTIRLLQFEHYSNDYNACYLYSNKLSVVNAIKELINSPPLKVDKLNNDYSQEIKIKQFKKLGL